MLGSHCQQIQYTRCSLVHSLAVCLPVFLFLYRYLSVCLYSCTHDQQIDMVNLLDPSTCRSPAPICRSEVNRSRLDGIEPLKLASSKNLTTHHQSNMSQHTTRDCYRWNSQGLDGTHSCHPRWNSPRKPGVANIPVASITHFTE